MTRSVYEKTIEFGHPQRAVIITFVLISVHWFMQRGLGGCHSVRYTSSVAAHGGRTQIVRDNLGRPPRNREVIRRIDVIGPEWITAVVGADMDPKQIIIIVVVAIWLVMLGLMLLALPTWLRALRGGAAIPIPKVIMLRLQGFKVGMIVDEYVRARKEGASVGIDEVALLWRSSPRTFQADVQSLIIAKRSATK